MEYKKNEKIILYAIIAIGYFLRLAIIDLNSLWLDEGSTFVISQLPPQDIWLSMMQGEFNPPLFYWLTHIMLHFGYSEFVLRFIPCHAGVLTIPAMYLLLREIYDGTAGLIAAFMIAISPWHIMYSVEARAYTLALLFFTLSLIYFVRSMRLDKKEDGYIVWILFGFWSAVAFWTHFYVLIFIASLMLCSIVYAFAYDRKKFGGVITGIFTFALFSIPLFRAIASILNMRTGAASSGIIFGVSGFNVVSETFYQLLGFGWISAFIILGMMILGFVILYKRDYYLTLTFLTTICASFAVSIVLAPSLNILPRYLCYMLPLWVILFSTCYPILTLNFRKENQNMIPLISVLILVFIVLTPSIISVCTIPYKTDWRSTSKYLIDNVNEGDIIAPIPGFVNQPLQFYYTRDDTRTHLVYNVSDMENAYMNKGDKKIYFLLSNDLIGSSQDAQNMLNWLRTHGKSTKEFNGVLVVVV